MNTLDEYFSQTVGSEADSVLDQSPPSEPTVSVLFDDFCGKAQKKWASQGVLFFTFTINSKLKYKNKYLIRCVPHKQAKYFKVLVKEVLNQFDKDTGLESHYYVFFEYTKAGVIHCHGLLYHEDSSVITAYPFYSGALQASAIKHHFNKIGVKVEPAKSFYDCKKYISKDKGKHPTMPIYG